MHLVNNLKKSHIDFEKAEKEHLASSWIEEAEPDKIVKKWR